MLVPHSTRSRQRADISLSLSLSLFFDSRYGLRREGGKEREQVLKAGIDIIADVIQKLCSNAF